MNEVDAEPRRRRRFPLVFALAALVLAADQVTKFLAEEHLTEGVFEPLLGEVLQLTLLYNSGAAFSLGTTITPVLTVLQGGISVVIVWLALRRVRSYRWAITLGMLLGGALGNFSDRMLRSPGPLRGHVVDFLALPNWPIFNIADIFVVSGAVLVALLTVFGLELDGTRVRSEKDAPAEKAAPPEQDAPPEARADG